MFHVKQRLFQRVKGCVGVKSLLSENNSDWQTQVTAHRQRLKCTARAECLPGAHPDWEKEEVGSLFLSFPSKSAFFLWTAMGRTERVRYEHPWRAVANVSYLYLGFVCVCVFWDEHEGLEIKGWSNFQPLTDFIISCSVKALAVEFSSHSWSEMPHLLYTWSSLLLLFALQSAQHVLNGRQVWRACGPAGSQRSLAVVAGGEWGLVWLCWTLVKKMAALLLKRLCVLQGIIEPSGLQS